MADLFKVFGEDFLYVPGSEGRFSALFPWDVLNRVLRQHRLEYPRLRLFRSGKVVPVAEYAKTGVGRKQRSTVSRLMPGELIAQLQGGATLVVDAVDELHEPLTALAASLERDLREKIQVNLYAGWHTSPGFDIHWDDHDVIVLQLAGRKSWSIYGETRKHPLANDVVKDTTPPPEPIWEQTISDGDLLYIPRGFWHAAKPLNEASLHLTIGIPNRTGIDLMTWFAQRLRGIESFRRDLPKFKCKEERDAHYAGLFDRAKEMLNEQLVEEFLAEQDANAVPRVSLNLPHIASKPSVTDLLGGRFRLSTPRNLIIVDEGSLVRIAANRKTYRFKNAARPILELLNERRPVSVEDVAARVDGKLDRKTVEAFVKELLSFGLISALDQEH